MDTSVIILTAVAVGLLTYWLYRLEKIRRHFDKLGGLPSIPILGNVHQLKRNPVDFTKQLFQLAYDYGHLKAFRIMIGSHPLVLVCSPQEAEPLMNSSKHLDKSIDYNFLHPWLATGLLTSTGDKWKTRRRLLTPTFHFKILHDFVGVFNDQSKILLKKMMSKADGQSTVDVYVDVTLCALDIICETAMGRSVNAQQDSGSDYVTSVNRASQYLFLRLRTPWMWPNFLFNLVGPGKDFDRCLSILHGFTEKVIRERQACFTKSHNKEITMEQLLQQQNPEEEARSFSETKQRLAFLDMLLCATTDGEKLSFHDIREEVDTFMFEGHDTTAMATNWALHLIGCDPEVHRKVQSELDHIFGNSDRDATMDDLKEMKYLECCIKEALRIFPSVPMFGRSITEDTVIAGVNIPKGTSVLICPAAIHRIKDIYPDPEKFDPDRFLSDNNRHPYAYIPFSAGARNCIGQKFALLEEKVILSTIFRNLSVKSAQTREELLPAAELILRPSNGIKVILTKRKREATT